MGLIRLFVFFMTVYWSIRIGRALMAALRQAGQPRPQVDPRQTYQYHYQQQQRQRQQQWQQQAPRPREPVPLTPYEVLGVTPGASMQEIKRAYQTLVRQYHPDKVTDLGLELRDLAEKRTKEINAAYNQLKRG